MTAHAPFLSAMPAGRGAVEAALDGIQMPREIRTERLILTPFEMHHLNGFAEFWADPDTTRFIGGPTDRAGALLRMARFSGLWRLYGFGTYALSDEHGRLHGYAGLWFPHDWAEPEIAYGLLPAARGKGIAQEAVRAIRSIAEAVGVPSLVSTIAPENHGSRRVAGSVGATISHRHMIDLHEVDIWRYPMNPAEPEREPLMLESRVMPLTITTERLRLRQWHPADFPRYAGMLATTRLAGVKRPAAALFEASRSFMGLAGTWHLRGYGLYAVEHDGRFIGSVGLGHPGDWPGPEIAYSLTTDARGQGFATEAVAAVRAVAAEQGLNRLVSFIDPANARSRALARRVGATADGTISLAGTQLEIWRHQPEGAADYARILELEPAL